MFLKGKRAFVIIAISFLIRLGMWIHVLQVGGWFVGDSPHYLHFATEVCQGHWGGEPVKGPAYLWYLCSLSHKLDYPILENNPPPAIELKWTLALPLFVQAMTVWLAGFILWILTRNQWALLLWMFEPTLFVYSFLVMPEGMFAAFSFVSILSLFVLLKENLKGYKSWGMQIVGGLSGAMAILSRSNGFALALLMGAILFYAIFKKRSMPWRSVSGYFCVLMSLLLMRFMWNVQVHQVWGLSNQGDRWIQSVAAVVENAPLGLDAPNAERKWMADHGVILGSSSGVINSHEGPILAKKIILENMPSFLLLSLKGILKSMFGHSNVEWGTLLTGQAPVGPGWFGPKESRLGSELGLFGTLIWIIGMTLSCVSSVIILILIMNLRSKNFLEWLLIGYAALITMMPLVFGESRFRVGAIPLLLLVISGAIRDDGKK